MTVYYVTVQTAAAEDRLPVQVTAGKPQDGSVGTARAAALPACSRQCRPAALCHAGSDMPIEMLGHQTRCHPTLQTAHVVAASRAWYFFRNVARLSTF